MPEPANIVSNTFERGFLKVALETQIRHCDDYELAPLFRRWFSESQPILEAGCGSGRWVAWFDKQGWQSVGLDWSAALCARATTAFPQLRFEPGDMQAMPFADGEFGSIVALGSIEHSSAGPAKALREFARVLRPAGVAIITVPYLGPIRRVTGWLSSPVAWLKSCRPVRRLTGKIGWQGRSRRAARQATRPGWSATFSWDENGCSFYEYRFTKVQMQEFLRGAGLEIVEESVAFVDEGIFHCFGRLAGRFDLERAVVVFNPLGRLLRAILPLNSMGHMLCYVVRKTSANTASVRSATTRGE